MDEIRLPQHIVDGIERRWAAKLEQTRAISSSRPIRDGGTPASSFPASRSGSDLPTFRSY